MSDTSNPPSIRDIAEIAGVSVATVSRVLNKKGKYSATTEKRVLAATSPTCRPRACGRPAPTR